MILLGAIVLALFMNPDVASDQAPAIGFFVGYAVLGFFIIVLGLLPHKKLKQARAGSRRTKYPIGIGAFFS